MKKLFIIFGFSTFLLTSCVSQPGAKQPGAKVENIELAGNIFWLGYVIFPFILLSHM